MELRLHYIFAFVCGTMLVNGGNPAPKPKPKPKPKPPTIYCGKVERSCQNDIFAARCTGDQTLKSRCCSPKDPDYKYNKRECPDEMKALETSCKSNTFEGLDNKIQVNGKSLPCECTPYLCDAEIDKRIDTEKKGKGPYYHVDITEGPCCDIKSEYYNKCPKEMKIFEENSSYSCKMVFVDRWWQRCKKIDCAWQLNNLKKSLIKFRKQKQKSYDAWKSNCCSKSMLHEQCPTEMASFNKAAGSCD